MVDHFQEEVYLHPEMTRRSGGKSGWSWRRCTGPILTGRTFRITAPAAGGSVSFIFIWISFYYIDYCLAQSVALMFWDAAQKDRKGAWDKYEAYLLQRHRLPSTTCLRRWASVCRWREGALSALPAPP